MGIKKTEDDRWYGHDSDGDLWGDCDCCGKNRPLSRCWASGIETFACDECRGFEEEDDEQLRFWTEQDNA